MLSLEEFEATADRAQALEPMRAQLYERALRLIQSDYEIEAYILILATWNFARFRYVTRTFELDRFRQTIAELAPVFERLTNHRFETIDVSVIAPDIVKIYSTLRPLVEQTGAAKIMHFKRPRLFVMWDTAIRRYYRVPSTCSAADYLQFLHTMKTTFGHLPWTRTDRPFAKAIDEYNFVLVHGGAKATS